MWSRFGVWLLTDAGKKCSYFAAGALATGSMLAHTLPHSMCLKQYKEFLQLYKNGFTVPLSQKLEANFQKTLDLLEIDEEDKHLYQPFSAYGFDIISAGSSFSLYGVLVGLPANFAYRSPLTIDRSAIKIRQQSVNWEVEAAQHLAESLVLSEKAQIYAIAREIKYRQTLKPVLDAAFSVISITGAYGLANTINKRLDLYSKPRALRFLMYAIVGAFTFGSYALCKDGSQIYYEDRIDRELIEKNRIFADGGLEFYTKTLNRNIALRQLLGKEGESLYSIFGNENAFVRYKHIPLVQRKLSFQEVNNL